MKVLFSSLGIRNSSYSFVLFNYSRWSRASFTTYHIEFTLEEIGISTTSNGSVSEYFLHLISRTIE